VVFWRLRYKLSLRDLPEMFLMRGSNSARSGPRLGGKTRPGALVDVRLSETRDMEAAKAFFRPAKIVTGVVPARVTTDRWHDNYRRAMRTELSDGVKHGTNQ
jgi:putative transposase